jgi:D-3-phosphoglycerate dehydrogenase / 2-oxoglutarate reductase
MSGKRWKIVIAECGGFPAQALATLTEHADLALANVNRRDLLSAIEDADVLWVRLRHRIDAAVMAAGPRLRIIVTPTTGLNHLDVDEAERRGILVLSLRGEEAFLKDVRATAEHTVALILSLIRHVPAAVAHVQAGGWNRDQFKGRELYAKTVGVVGYGRLGRIVARYLSAFDARILVADPHLEATSTEPDVTPVSLHDLLPQADIVTMHVNLCERTRGLFGPREFALMKPGSWFINTARGELVDEDALVDALQSGRLAGAALDVLSHEGSGDISDYPLVAYAREHDNLIITPHVGGCTVESMEKTELFLANRLADILRRHATM